MTFRIRMFQYPENKDYTIQVRRSISNYKKKLVKSLQQPFVALFHDILT